MSWIVLLLILALTTLSATQDVAMDSYSVGLVNREEEGVMFGLVLIILLALKYRAESIPAAVAAYITSACCFTSLTSFANPVVTLARAMTNTFAGISPQSVPLFVCGQIFGGAAATLLARWLVRRTKIAPM